MSSPILNLLGLAMKAGKIDSGEGKVIDSVRNNRLCCVFLSEDASFNTKKKVLDKCHYYGVPCKILFSRTELGKAIGKAERVVLGVNDQGFCNRFLQLIKEEDA